MAKKEKKDLSGSEEKKKQKEENKKLSGSEDKTKGTKDEEAHEKMVKNKNGSEEKKKKETEKKKKKETNEDKLFFEFNGVTMEAKMVKKGLNKKLSGSEENEEGTNDEAKMVKKDRNLSGSEEKKKGTAKEPEPRPKMGMRVYFNERRTIIWWDIENLGIPTGFPPELVYDRMLQSLRDDGFVGEVQIYIVVPFSDCKVPPVLLKKMKLFRARNYPRPTDPSDPERKDNQISDNYIRKKNFDFLKRNPKPHNVMIPTGDVGFRDVADALKKKGHNFLMAYDSNPNQKCQSSKKLVKRALRCWDWRAFFGLGPVKTKRVRRLELAIDHKSELDKLRARNAGPEEHAALKKKYAELKKSGGSGSQDVGGMSLSNEIKKLQVASGWKVNPRDVEALKNKFKEQTKHRGEEEDEGEATQTPMVIDNVDESKEEDEGEATQTPMVIDNVDERTRAKGKKRKGKEILNEEELESLKEFEKRSRKVAERQRRGGEGGSKGV